jgi:hypothetical protein
MDNELFIQRLKELAQLKPVNRTNPSEGFEIKQIKHQAKPCDDCGKEVINRRIWNRVLFTPERHWRKTCSGCNLNQHPETGKYTISQNGAKAFFSTFINNRDK